jgi:ParB family chromosome partitioning protein
MDNEKGLAVNERPPEGRVLCLPCHLLVDHSFSTGFYDQAHLAGLTASIKETGLLEPILVRPCEGGRYQILSGHYRLRAVRRLRWAEVTCRVQQCDDCTALVIYCTSNLLTRGLCAVEEACLLEGLIREGGFTMEQAGALWGRSKSWVSRRLKLLTALDPQIMGELGLGRLKPRLAQELARLPRGNDQSRVLATIKKHCLNKDEAAALISRWLAATEEERTRIETAELAASAAVTPKEDCGQARTYVTDCLKRCILVIEDITGFLQGQNTPFDWWPKKQYRIFLNTVDALDGIVHDSKGEISEAFSKNFSPGMADKTRGCVYRSAPFIP